MKQIHKTIFIYIFFAIFMYVFMYCIIYLMIFNYKKYIHKLNKQNKKWLIVLWRGDKHRTVNYSCTHLNATMPLKVRFIKEKRNRPWWIWLNQNFWLLERNPISINLIWTQIQSQKNYTIYIAVLQQDKKKLLY